MSDQEAYEKMLAEGRFWPGPCGPNEAVVEDEEAERESALHFSRAVEAERAAGREPFADHSK